MYDAEDVAMNEVECYTTDENEEIANNEECEVLYTMEDDDIIVGESEDAVPEEESHGTSEVSLNPTKKKESGYFEDNRKEKLDNLIERYTEQYGGAVLSIGCSLSTESDELIIDEEAGSALSDLEDSERSFSVLSSCSTETAPEATHYSDEISARDSAIFTDSIIFADDLEIMQEIEIPASKDISEDRKCILIFFYSARKC